MKGFYSELGAGAAISEWLVWADSVEKGRSFASPLKGSANSRVSVVSF